MISYQAINMSQEQVKNVEADDVNAVTWGVFRNKEVIQPTVVDHQAFKLWGKQAFTTLMAKWAAIYDEESKSHNCIKQIYNSYYLMNIVHNDFVNGDLNNVML